MLSGFTLTGDGWKEVSKAGKSRIRPGQGIIVQDLAPFKSLQMALNSASPRSLVKGASRPGRVGSQRPEDRAEAQITEASGRRPFRPHRSPVDRGPPVGDC